MNKVDLSLVPIEELIEELAKRSPSVVVGYIAFEKGKKRVKSQWDGEWLDNVGVAQVLLNDILRDSTDE